MEYKYKVVLFIHIFFTKTNKVALPTSACYIKKTFYTFKK